MGVNFPGGNCPGGNYWRVTVRGATVLERFHGGGEQLSGWLLYLGKVIRGKLSGGNYSGGDFLRVIVWGFLSRGNYSKVIVWGQKSGGNVLGVNC